MRSAQRLRELPWAELAGLGPLLDGPLAAVLGGAEAARSLAGLLRRHQQRFDARQRRIVAEALFGVALWRRRLDPAGDRTPRELLVRLARDLGGWHAAAAALGADPPPTPEPGTLGERCSLPDWLVDELRAAAGAEAEALADALGVPGPVCLRPNSLRLTRTALAGRLAAEGVQTVPCRWAPDGLRVTSPRPNVHGLPSWQQGLCEVQDEGSQLLGALVAAQPGMRVLDLCAGAGGKTLLLAGQLGGQGELHATDLDAARLRRLELRCRRAGVTTLQLHARDALPALPFDRVLVDAPCSELGPLRRGPDRRWLLRPEAFAALPALQLALLVEAAGRLAPGGRLVYATCTWRAAENEQVVQAGLARCPWLHRVRPPLDSALLDDQGALRLWPQRHDTDGFYGVVLEAAAGSAARGR